MFERWIFVFVLWFNFLSVFTQEPATNSDGSAEKNLVSIVGYMHDLSDVGTKYYKKHGEVLPILCSNCKKRALSLGEFVGGLIGRAMKDAVEKKDFVKIKTIIPGK
jgi:hypothetical protein